MSELSDERIRNDEIEIHYYGYSSTQIYMHYRESIDNRLKILMLELSKFYDNLQTKDPETVSYMLIEKYNAFWAAAEPVLEKFYKDIQITLSLPKTFLPKSLTSPQEVYCDSEVPKIDNEIQNLEDQYMSERYYLHALEQRKKQIEENCIPLKNQIDLAIKLLKDNMRKMEHFDVLNAKRMERMDKFLEGFDKKALWENKWKGGKSETKEKENMKNFMGFIEKNKIDNKDNV